MNSRPAPVIAAFNGERHGEPANIRARTGRAVCAAGGELWRRVIVRLAALRLPPPPPSPAAVLSRRLVGVHSGEESSGEEDGPPAAAAAAAPAEEEDDDRLEGESKAARDRRVHQENMRAARAERKEGKAEADQGLAKKNVSCRRPPARSLRSCVGRLTARGALRVYSKRSRPSPRPWPGSA